MTTFRLVRLKFISLAPLLFSALSRGCLFRVGVVPGGKLIRNSLIRFRLSACSPRLCYVVTPSESLWGGVELTVIPFFLSLSNLYDLQNHFRSACASVCFQYTSGKGILCAFRLQSSKFYPLDDMQTRSLSSFPFYNHHTDTKKLLSSGAFRVRGMYL